MPETVERRDIQGIVASGYDHLDYARFVFLRILDLHRAQNWLKSIVPTVTTAVYPENKPKTCFNIAITSKGLRELGITDGLIQDFPHEFLAGMNRPEAALILGDTGESRSEQWQYGGSETEPFHVLALLFGESAHALESLCQNTCSPNARNGGLDIVIAQDSIREHGDFSEPFGFRDSISQPLVKGLTGKRKQVGDSIQTGEFVLGYENELGLLTRIPSIDSWHDPFGYLAEHPKQPDKLRAFGLNGTYLVFRKLYQDVKGFWKFVESKSGNDPHRKERIASKMVGRWRSGAPLVLAPHTPGAKPENDFLYAATDPDGLACPIGSHIRRANPRDSLTMPPFKSLQVSRRHRIIRRGRKYCELAERSTAGNLEYDKGLYFIALNADLRRQFEFIQQTWLNNPTFNGLDNERDPIVGDNTSAGEFTIQKRPVNRHLSGLQRFVTLRGGGYFFLPGIRALKFLSNYRRVAATVHQVGFSACQADELPPPK